MKTTKLLLLGLTLALTSCYEGTLTCGGAEYDSCTNSYIANGIECGWENALITDTAYDKEDKLIVFFVEYGEENYVWYTTEQAWWDYTLNPGDYLSHDSYEILLPFKGYGKND